METLPIFFATHRRTLKLKEQDKTKTTTTTTTATTVGKLT